MLENVSFGYDKETTPMESQQYGCFNKTYRLVVLGSGRVVGSRLGMPAVAHVLSPRRRLQRELRNTATLDDGLVCWTQEGEEVEHLQLALAGGRVLAGVKYNSLLAPQS